MKVSKPKEYGMNFAVFVELRPHALLASLSMIVTEFMFVTVRKTSFEINVIAQLQIYVYVFKNFSN